MSARDARSVAPPSVGIRTLMGAAMFERGPLAEPLAACERLHGRRAERKSLLDCYNERMTLTQLDTERAGS